MRDYQKLKTDKVLTTENHIELSEIINSATGLHFPAEKFIDIERGVRYILKEKKFKNVNDLFLWIKGIENETEKIDLITKYFTIGETYFFRDKNIINALNNHILPEIIQRKEKGNKRIKIWSAASSTGEEIYTLAILMEEILKDKEGWEVILLGSDINKEFLNKAKKGIYSKWSIRGDDFPVLNEYITPLPNNLYEVKPLIKSRIKFFHLNLKTGNYPSNNNDLNSMDLILCRNVLMYFDEETKTEVVKKLRKTLAEKAWIIFSPFDLNDEIKKLFSTVSIEDTVVYKVSDMEDVKTEIKYPSELKDAGIKIPSPVRKHRVSTFKNDKKDINRPNRLLRELDRKEIDNDEIKLLFNNGKYSEIIKLHTNKEIKSVIDEEIKIDYYTTLLKSYANLGLLNEFEKEVSDILLNNKMSAELHFVCGSIYREFNELQKSINLLKKALYLNHNFIMAEFMLGIIYRTQGDKVNAKRCFRNLEKMLKPEEDNNVLYFSEGMKVRDIKSAIQRYSNE